MQDRVAVKISNSEARVLSIDSCLGLNPPLPCGMSLGKFLKVSQLCLLKLACFPRSLGVPSHSSMPLAESQKQL